MASRFSFRATLFILAMVMVMPFTKCLAEVQRHMLIPPFRGQFSEFSEWSIPEQAFVEITNAYVNEQGLIQTRSGFYCFMDSVSTSKPILGAVNYKRWIEGGSREYFVWNTNNKIYYTTPGIHNTNTDISAGITYSDNGIPVWLIHYNDMFMANGEECPIRWNQDANCITIGYCAYTASITFEDTNEVVSAGGTSFESGAYHFRPGWDLIISDSNNNDGTYEIKSVDTNVIVLQTTSGTAATLTAGTDSCTITGIGYPPEISTTRTETITHNAKPRVYFDATYDYILEYDVDWYSAGFREGMTITVSGTTNNNGSYTVDHFDSFVFLGKYYYGQMYVTGSLTTETDTSGCTITGTKTVTNSANAFNPMCITGHKSRLFVGGVKEYPTYLFFTVSKLLTTQGTYYYDMWRDRVNTVDGSGYIDLQDKIIALIGDWQDSLIIGCENRIMRLRGDDPGFDILTPSQTLIYHPDPISLNTGFVGPNAWCEANGDIYFMSKSGLQQLRLVEQGGTAKYTVLSLPINDLVDSIINVKNYKKISMKFLKNMNLILINCAINDNDNDSIIVFNISNQSFSKWTFTSGSEPNCLFISPGTQIDPNNTSSFPSDEPDPYETCWIGSQDGKLWALNQSYDYDRDYEDPNNSAENAFTPIFITAKLNMGNPFLLKNYQRAVFMLRQLHNYSPDPNYGTVYFYRKIDNDSWSSAVARNFSAISGTAGAAIDQYRFIDMFSSISGTGRTIQYKITTDHKFGLELMGIYTEWEESGYEPWD